MVNINRWVTILMNGETGEKENILLKNETNMNADTQAKPKIIENG